MKCLVISLLLSLACSAPTTAADFLTKTFNVSPSFFGGNDTRSAREVLEVVGIAFPVGSTVTFNPIASQLTVRNTPEQVARVETFLKKTSPPNDNRVYITTKFVRSVEPLVEDAFALKPSGPESRSRAQANVISKEEGISFLSAPTLPDLIRPNDFLITGVFTVPQFEMFEKGLKKNSIHLTACPSVVSASKQFAVTRHDDFAVGVEAMVNPDGFTINLEVYMRSQAIRFRKTPRAIRRASLTIWDGQSVMLTEKTGERSFVTTFISATIQDAEGKPVHEVSQPSRAQSSTELEGAIFKKE